MKRCRTDSRERNQKVSFRVSLFRASFRVLEFCSSLLCVVDNKLFCITTSIITRVILLPQRREYGSICDAKANIYIYIYNAGTCQHPPK